MKNSDQFLNDTNSLVLQRFYLDRSWISRAACKDTKEDFFPHFNWRLGAHNRPRTIEIQREQAYAALQICATCTVVDECKRNHLHEREGVFFGTVPAERQLLRNRNTNCTCLWCRDYRRRYK